MKRAVRLKNLQQGIFSRIENLAREVAAKGMNIINLGVGSPDLPPAPHIYEALVKAAADTGNYGYTLTEGLVNPGDVVLVPDPEYPIYSCGVYLADGIVYPMPILKANNFLPDLRLFLQQCLKKPNLSF